MKINLKEGQELFFTSDTHYSHANICAGTSNWTDASKTRDFDDSHYMDLTIVNNINCVVKEDDILIHLGDWSFGGIEKVSEFRNRLACQSIHIVTGNHDHHIDKNKVQGVFASINKYLELEVASPACTTKFVLMHFPIASWDNMSRGVIHLHGHVHFSPRYKLSAGKMMDVGMDGNALMPYSLRQINSIMSKQPIRSLFNQDHHK